MVHIWSILEALLNVRRNNMFTLEDVRKEYDRLDALLGIDTKNVELKISKGFRTAGLFQVKRDKKTNDLKMIIRINKVVFECCSASFFEIVRHEYAHAANHIIHNGNCDIHGPMWKEMCHKVGSSGEVHVNKDSDVHELLNRERSIYRSKNKKPFNWDEYLEEIGRQFEQS